jgi:oxygen-dependent protoporphyrinogen oxidase
MFVTMKDGMGVLIETLRGRLAPGSILLGKSVIALEREGGREGPSYRIGVSGGERLVADAVVLAAPSFVSGELLAGLDKPLRDLLDTIPYVSSAIVHLAYRTSEIHDPLDGFGFVVPRSENRSIMASTWTSVKFAHRAPEGHVLLRVFIGGAKNEAALDLDDAEMVAVSRKEMREIMGIEADPLFSRVYRWEKSMPQYRIGHLDRVAQIRERVSMHPGIFLTGCAYRGVGISDCIHEGELTAEKVLEYLRRGLFLEKTGVRNQNTERGTPSGLTP